MKKFSVVICMLLMVVVLASTSSSVLAQDKIADDILSQQRRVERGVAEKWLTPGEAQTLMDNLEHIRSVHNRAVADGSFQSEEVRRHIWGMLNQNREMISRDKRAAIIRLY